jgi:DNA-binding transcriptional MerR regulator
MDTLYSIGEFSQITGLSVKTLRFYHEKGILLPSTVDDVTGYRSYDESKLEKARVIVCLRAMEFSISDIAAMLGECDDDADVLNYLERQKRLLQQRIQNDRDVIGSLNEIIARERNAKQFFEGVEFEVEEKAVDPILVAGIRMKGNYRDCGLGFSRLSKSIGRHICGKALCLYYDGEYREDDADFEPCFPIRKEVAVKGVSVRTLPARRCLTLIHRGPYEQLGHSYGMILKQAINQKLEVSLPTREVYIKGPGMIFKGATKNYLTEIQLPICS